MCSVTRWRSLAEWDRRQPGKLARVPLRHPHVSQCWCQAGSGSWSCSREAAWSCRLLGCSPESCSHPSLGAPGEEGAWLPPAVLTLMPDSSRELGRVNVHPHVTLWAGMGLVPHRVQVGCCRHAAPGQAGEQGARCCRKHRALHPGGIQLAPTHSGCSAWG